MPKWLRNVVIVLVSLSLGFIIGETNSKQLNAYHHEDAQTQKRADALFFKVVSSKTDDDGISAMQDLMNAPEARVWCIAILCDKDIIMLPYENLTAMDRSSYRIAMANYLLCNLSPTRADKALLWSVTTRLTDQSQGAISTKRGFIIEREIEGKTPMLRDSAHSYLVKSLGIDDKFDIDAWRKDIMELP